MTMLKFRRSVKGEKFETKPNHISIPPKDAIAIVPPKKVIKALYDYEAPSSDLNSNYLSFSQGDFLHVVGRENDTDWYEACNPLHGTRGLVPAQYFEGVGKTVRDSSSSTKSVPVSTPNVSHDSGYAMEPPPPSGGGGDPGALKGLRLSKMGNKVSGSVAYGVVMYDFKAERPDELEAKEGETIIVIAQSNPEWIVAKPITRLGGPGLIPVSFIEIHDMATGQAVADPQEAVRRAGVPRVEEWKRLIADYKKGSIPLGKLEANAGLQSGMDRMSLNGNGGASDGFGAAQNGHLRSSSQQMDPNVAARQSAGQMFLAPVKAKVPRYCFADEIFWFVVEAQMEDGKYWELSRLYQDFYDLQINLIQEHPLEAGNVQGVERSLPYMPGPVTYVTDNISNGRRANLDEYIKNLLKLGPHVTRSHIVRRFFAPRNGDYEIEPDASWNGYRLSAASQRSSQHGASRQSSSGNLGLGPQGAQTPSGSAPVTGGAVKVKVWFEQDNCVVLRMPANFRFFDLNRKLRDRRALEKPGEDTNAELVIEYRDEVVGKFYRIENDEDLSLAMERNPKLTLSVSAVS